MQQGPARRQLMVLLSLRRLCLDELALYGLRAARFCAVVV